MRARGWGALENFREDGYGKEMRPEQASFTKLQVEGCGIRSENICFECDPPPIFKEICHGFKLIFMHNNVTDIDEVTYKRKYATLSSWK